MRTTDVDFLDEQAHSTFGDQVEVSVRRGSDVLDSPLALAGWSLDWDVTRSAQGQMTLDVLDPDGSLAPWALSDMLGPGGSRLSCAWVSGSTGFRLPLGVYRIRSSDPAETWRMYPFNINNRKTHQIIRVSGGATIALKADEEMASAGLARLDAETAPKGATIFSEIRRLMADICAVEFDAALTDRSFPGDYVYGDNRADAIDDLLTMIFARHRFAGDGVMQVIPERGVETNFTLQGGDDGLLVSVSRSLSDGDVRNAVISTGQDAAGRQIVARSYDLDGPLGWNSPFGPAPMFHQAIAKTQAGVQKDADTLLKNLRGGGEVILSVVALANPAVQPYDIVTLVAPAVGSDFSLRGRVVKMHLASQSGTATPAKTMTLGIAVPMSSLAWIAGRVDRG